jgi:hypothetical protein
VANGSQFNSISISGGKSAANTWRGKFKAVDFLSESTGFNRKHLTRREQMRQFDSSDDNEMRAESSHLFEIDLTMIEIRPH